MESNAVILIVDDEAANLRLLQGILRPEGYHLEVATNGQQALSLARQLKPDVMLLDIMMPQLDGFEVCRLARQDPQLEQMPIIMVTALDDRDGRSKAIEAGADDLLTKPVDRSEVRMRVRSITRLNRYRRFQEERAKFERIAELSRDGYVLVNAEGDITYANPEAKRVLRLPERPSPAIAFIDCLKKKFQSDPEHAHLDWDSALDPQRKEPFRVVHPESESGSAFWLQVEVLPAGASQLEGTLVRLIDATGEMTHQRDLWKFHTQLAHKFRTPLVGLVGALELLGTEATVNEKADLKELVDISRHCVDQLKDHVEDVLRYLEAPSLGRQGESFNVEDFPDLVHHVAKQMEIQQVDVSVGPGLEQTELGLSQNALEFALGELFENARKFHPNQSPVLSVTLEALSERRLSLRVSDDGQTLPPDRLSKVWTPYYQSEKLPTGEVAGMGLGLSTVAAIMREQGGTCRLNNRGDGPGVTVEIQLNVPYDK